jgi:hypothetical protein
VRRELHSHGPQHVLLPLALGWESCDNAIRVKRMQLEDVLLRGEVSGLAAMLASQRIERMAKEMQTYYAERMRDRETRAAELYCRKVAQGLDGNAREALKARVFLATARKFFGFKQSDGYVFRSPGWPTK